jgi:ElaB/YqjD/DUF883 family membrane-anchored ribosome-binding protein
MTAKDTAGYLGCEDLDGSRLLRSLAAALDKIVASESAEAREQARALLAEVRPLIDKAADSPDQLRQAVRQHPLLAVGLAGLAGFIVASLVRR